jgi:hypothetical protein
MHHLGSHLDLKLQSSKVNMFGAYAKIGEKVPRTGEKVPNYMIGLEENSAMPIFSWYLYSSNTS